jgi:SAM-dependent methyltransferase
MDLRKRRRRPEIMDQPGLDAGQHRLALRGLARINRWSGSARILWDGMKQLLSEGRTSPLRLLDVATGGGDVPIRLWYWARVAGMPMAIDGCDLSPLAVDHAREQAKANRAGIGFFVWNALADPLPTGYDVVTSSLFLHHLAEEQAVVLLRRMAAMAGRLVLVNDLRRHPLGFLLAYFGTRLLTASAMVHTDGPRSVEAAFNCREVRQLAWRAGLTGAVVEPRWPFRLLLRWTRPRRKSDDK